MLAIVLPFISHSLSEASSCPLFIWHFLSEASSCPPFIWHFLSEASSCPTFNWQSLSETWNWPSLSEDISWLTFAWTYNPECWQQSRPSSVNFHCWVSDLLGSCFLRDKVTKSSWSTLGPDISRTRYLEASEGFFGSCKISLNNIISTYH